MWVSCTLWGKRAESLAQHLTKGKGVFVAGEYDVTDKDDGGVWHNVSVDRSEFMGGRSEPRDQRTETEDDMPF